VFVSNCPGCETGTFRNKKQVGQLSITNPLSAMLTHTDGNSQPRPLVEGLVKWNGKYYLELNDYPNSELENGQRVVELSIALAMENEAQRERIAVLEGKLKALGEM
jgi:hypothetical protein